MGIATLNGAAFATATVLAAWSPRADAQVVRWMNPAGGTFAQGSNWDAGHAPGTTETASFGPDATYTVTLDAAKTVGGLVADQGAPTLDLGRVTLSVGPPGSSGQLRVRSTAGQTSMRLVNGGVTTRAGVNVQAAPGSSATLVIEPSVGVSIANSGLWVGGGGNAAVVLRGSMGDGGISSQVNLAQGSTFRVEGGSFLGQYVTASGRIDAIGGDLHAQTWTFGASSEVYASGTIITNESAFFSNQGLISLTGGATLDINMGGGGDISGRILIDGPGTLVRGEMRGSPSITIRNGGSFRPYILTLNGPSVVYLAADSVFITSVDLYFNSGTFHVEAPATATVGGYFRMGSSAVLEPSIDGAALPAGPTVNITSTPEAYRPTLGGAVRPLFSHPNNLRVGDQVEVLRSACVAALNTTFAALDYQPLGGGRQLQLAYTDHSAFVQVIAGGSPCWTADFDGDGDVGTDADIQAFFACVGGECCATCASADFNGDGDVGADADIESFFRVLAGGPC
jgi:hypothetical protein